MEALIEAVEVDVRAVNGAVSGVPDPGLGWVGTGGAADPEAAGARVGLGDAEILAVLRGAGGLHEVSVLADASGLGAGFSRQPFRAQRQASMVP